MPKKEPVKELTSKEFYELINDKNNHLVIVDFFAEWCLPCTIMSPIIEQLAEKYNIKLKQKVKFAKANVDDVPDLANKYEISSIPCIIFFQDGKEVDRLIGGVSEYVLNEKIRDYL